MTAVRRVIIACNGCGVTVEYDSWCETAAATRAEARAFGWRTGLPGGVDLCDSCRDTDDSGSRS